MSWPNGQLNLELLELPRENRIPGPVQAYQALTNGDDAARQQINLLQAGNQARVVYGNLLSLPYANGMLYVQPVYVESVNVQSPFPLMRLVLVSYGSTVGFALYPAGGDPAAGSEGRATAAGWGDSATRGESAAAGRATARQ